MNKSIWVVALCCSMAACAGSKYSSKNIKMDLQGHRGCRGLMPENTIPAMLKAIDLKVTTLEMDVVISKDNQVVVSHDPYFNYHITTTPQGKTLTKAEGEKQLLYTMPYDSIRKFDVGLKPHPDFPKQQKIAAYKPLLSELFIETEKASKAKKQIIFYNIEIKSKEATDGIKHPAIEAFVDLVMEVINQKGIAKRVTIQSFDPRALQVMHRKYPSVTTSFLVEANDKQTLLEHITELGFTPNVYSPNYALVNQALMDQCHGKKMIVIPWTVNSVEEMKRLLALNVDGLISDYPNLYSLLTF